MINHSHVHPCSHMSVCLCPCTRTNLSRRETPLWTPLWGQEHQYPCSSLPQRYHAGLIFLSARMNPWHGVYLDWQRVFVVINMWCRGRRGWQGRGEAIRTGGPSAILTLCWWSLPRRGKRKPNPKYAINEWRSRNVLPCLPDFSDGNRWILNRTHLLSSEEPPWERDPSISSTSCGFLCFYAVKRVFDRFSRTEGADCKLHRDGCNLWCWAET